MDRPKSAPHFVLDLYYSSVLVSAHYLTGTLDPKALAHPLFGLLAVLLERLGAHQEHSLAQSGNIRDVKLHQQEAEGLAGCHGAFVGSRAAGSQPAHLTASTPRAVPRCYIYGTYSLPQQEEHGCYAHQHFYNTAWK